MQNINSFLVDWAIKFLENRDVIRKNIVKIEKSKEECDFVIHYKDNVKYFFVKEYLEGDILSEIKNKEHVGIFTLNNKENVKFLVSNWKEYSKMRSLSIYFVNPFSNSDKVWTLRPCIHDKICDSSSLELGLKSMSDMVEPMGKLQLERKIKLKKEEPDL
jgi:hypothetical protein|tara:strand:- start:10 stop:489 length:480 start_codon:yes stop_codon:yes gene_type:complete